MDGNNRWSKKNNHPKYDSYKRGAKKLLDLSNFIFNNYNISYVSAFALSKHNLKRGSSILNIIQNILVDFIELNKKKNNYNFNIIFKGNLKIFPNKIVQGLKDLERSNSKNKKLIIYLNYSGKDDINSAAQLLNKTKSISNKNLNNYLKSSNIPDPDMLIRTGGFKRLSDFFLYQVSFTEFFFTKILWPDLKKSDIDRFITQFNRIDRKFGTWRK